jgi:thiamine pyrophosphokinase
MKAVIFCGGKAPSKSLVEEELQDAKIIICADGGANYLYHYNIIPHILVGDFDSIKPEILDYYKNHTKDILTYPVEKDDTDSEIALEKAFELGAEQVVFLGCTGSRIDHVFGNLGLLRRCLEAGVKAFIKDDNNSIFLIDNCISLKGEQGSYFSLQAYASMVKKLTIKGAKYPLFQYDLKVGDPITISNVFEVGEVEISFEEGLILVFYSKD